MGGGREGKESKKFYCGLTRKWLKWEKGFRMANFLLHPPMHTLTNQTFLQPRVSYFIDEEEHRRIPIQRGWQRV